MAKTHGRVSTYRTGRCRCPECREANRIAVARQRAQRSARLAVDPTIVEHGLKSTYDNWGCRCEACSLASRVDWYAWRIEKIRQEIAENHVTRTNVR